MRPHRAHTVEGGFSVHPGLDDRHPAATPPWTPSATVPTGDVWSLTYQGPRIFPAIGVPAPTGVPKQRCRNTGLVRPTH